MERVIILGQLGSSYSENELQEGDGMSAFGDIYQASSLDGVAIDASKVLTHQQLLRYVRMKHLYNL